jgi:putative membrane protein
MNTAQDRDIVPRHGRLAVFLRGLLMGSVDIVPGVSGGTMAFITGIYDRMIHGLGKIGMAEARALGALLLFFWHGERRRKALAVLGALDWALAAPLFLGIGIGIATMANIMVWLRDAYPVWCYAAFTGLIGTSVIFPFRHMRHGWLEWALLLGFAAALAAVMPPAHYVGQGAEAHLGFLFLCGLMAVGAFILPGVSGSYVLLMLGQYDTMTGAIKAVTRGLPGLFTGHDAALVGHNMLLILVFLSGVLIGLLTFARVVRILLDRWHSPTMAGLTGLMLGSLRALWPLQPGALEAQHITAADAWPGVAALILLAAGAVLLLDAVVRRHRKEHAS